MMAGTGRGPDGAPARRRAFAEFVRHALHAAAEQVEPRADGLESIRARIDSRPSLRDRLAARRRPGTGRRRGTRRDEPGAGAPIPP